MLAPKRTRTLRWTRAWPWLGLGGVLLLAVLGDLDRRRAAGNSDAALARPTPGLDRLLFAPRDDSRTPTLAQIRAAKRSIDVAQYRIDDKGVVQALADAARRGVRLRVVTHWGGDRCTFCPVLTAAGGDVRLLRWELHHKFATFDGSPAVGGVSAETVLLTSSGNWSPLAFRRHDEDWLQFSGDSAYTRAFQQEFEWLFAHAHDGQGRPGNGNPPSLAVPPDAPLRFSSANMRTWKHAGRWTYKATGASHVADWLIAGIDAAEHSIRMAQLLFNRRDVHDALHRALARGVKIELLLAGKQFQLQRPSEDSGEAYDEALADAGAKVRYKLFAFPPDNDASTRHVSMHMKFTLIDDTVVFTGSYNVSEYSQNQTMENMLRFDDAGVAGKYRARFQEIWNEGRGSRARLVQRVNAARGTGPCDFDAMTLSGPEILELRRQYRTEACPAPP